MTRSGSTTMPPVRPPFRRSRCFALHIISRVCRHVGATCANPPLAAIEQNGRSLNIISHYVDTAEDDERIVVAEAVRKLRELERNRAAAETTMNRYLAELGYGA